MLTSKPAKADGLLVSQHDRKLRAFFRLISEMIEAAQSKEDLVAVINHTNTAGGSLKFEHHRLKLLSLVCCLCAAATEVFSVEIYTQWQCSAIPFTVFFACCTVVLLIYMLLENAEVSFLSQRLYLRALLFDNGLHELKAELPALERQLFSDYYEFRRGDISREITAGYKGYYQGGTHSFDYTFYQFHYINLEKKKSASDHYRYGIVLNFRFVCRLTIAGKAITGVKGKCYRTPSCLFNQHFKVFAHDEMVAARFLKSSVVLAFEEITTVFKSLNLEFNRTGGLCMSFDNKEVVDGKPQYDFNAPGEFKHEIRAFNPLHELHTALEFIHALMVFSDNNFWEDNR